ncbi:hypothetical protein AB1Y20_019446 [Prymnesium parvum]|uniref:Cilia- and flagella-associated protein 58 central coiled coil domain-containing protein n=1 Tax=Prymnesium parvum TaxID=97485 RepID=A0AB34JSE7_PRYPA
MAETGFEHLTIDAASFEALEQDFEHVLEELTHDPQLERFLLEYETLFRALKKSHESEKRLMKKCRELTSEITNTSNKVANATKLSIEDQSIIAQLRKDIEKTWGAVETSQEKEVQIKEQLAALRKEIEELRESVEQGAGSSVAQENRLRDLTAMREDVARDRDLHAQQVMQVRSEVTELQERLKVLEAEKAAAETAVIELTTGINNRKAEAEKEKRRKEAEEKKLKELKGVIDKKTADIRAKQQRVNNGLEDALKLEHQLREQKQNTDKTLKEADGLTSKVAKLQAEYDEQIKHNASLTNENTQRQLELKKKHGEIEHLQGEIARMQKLRDAALKRVASLEGQKMMSDRQKEEVKVSIQEVEADIEANRRERENERKIIDDLVRERDVLQKNLVKSVSSTSQQEDLLKINENTKRNLEMNIQSYRASAQSLARSIKKVKAEKEKYAEECSEAEARLRQAQDEVKSREITILQLQKRIAEGEAKMKQQQNLYEAVRSDRNLYSKSLIESQDEIAEMKRKFKIMTRQIDQLKEEIQSKDHAHAKEHFEHLKVDKEKESLREALKAVIEQEESEEAKELRFKAEVGKLNQIINEAESERMKQQKEYEIVVNERDILGTQLIKRNDELAQLYEKIKLQQCTLNQGERHYSERMQDISVLQKDTALLRSELVALKASVSSYDSLRGETFQMQKELLQERTKVRALSEELDNQMNVHRWRKLEGSDPNRYSMIQRTHKLQKALIRKTEEVAEKDALIQQKEKLYVELKAILARQPGPEVAEQLAIYQNNLAEKQKQLKSMMAELSLHRQQVSDLKMEQESINQRIAGVKKKYFSKKQRERRQFQDMMQVMDDDISASMSSMMDGMGGIVMPPAASFDSHGPPMGLSGLEPGEDGRDIVAMERELGNEFDREDTPDDSVEITRRDVFDGDMRAEILGDTPDEAQAFGQTSCRPPAAGAAAALSPAPARAGLRAARGGTRRRGRAAPSAGLTADILAALPAPLVTVYTMGLW